MSALRKPIILVDMDGVLANFSLACYRRWKTTYPEKPVVELHEQKYWDICKQYEENEVGSGALMNDVYHIPGFYADIEKLGDCENVLDEMEAAGYEVFICTAPVSSADCMTDKVQWIGRVFGNKWLSRVILTKDKTLIRGAVLIDDKPHVTGLMTPEWTHVLFDQPYNRDIKKPRITNWENWVEVLKMIC
jgi:5'-nucleotidase